MMMMMMMMMMIVYEQKQKFAFSLHDDCRRPIPRDFFTAVLCSVRF